MKRLINEIPVKFTDLTLQNKLLATRTQQIKLIERLQKLHAMNPMDMFQINEVQQYLAKINRCIDVIELQMDGNKGIKRK